MQKVILLIAAILPLIFTVDVQAKGKFIVDCEGKVHIYDYVDKYVLNGKSNIDLLRNGFCDKHDRWVPSLPTWKSWRELVIPQHSIGNAVWYSPGKMEEVSGNMGIDITSYEDGVALMSCNYIGHTIWAKINGSWTGPYIVIDCPMQFDQFSAIYYVGEVVEFGFRTAEKHGWGTGADNNLGYITNSALIQDIEICTAIDVSECADNPVGFVNWWLGSVRFTNGLAFSEAWEQNPPPA